jgi:hypothetical protein
MERESDLARLDKAWKDPGAHVFTLVAFGGTGKSALVSDWIDLLSERNQWDENVAALAWTFSGRGTETPAGPFFEWALDLCGDPASLPGESQEQRGARLAKLLQQWRTLLILDGVESLQYQYTDGPLLDGKLKDLGLIALLHKLALSNRGLCVVTTQDPIRELDSFSRTAPQYTLSDLPEEEAVKLLQRLTGARRTQDVLDAVSAARRHALTLTLLGNFLAKAHPGNFKAWREVGLHEADGHEGGASQMIAAYEKRLDGHMLAILRALALFDRPVDLKILRVLQEQSTVQGITEGLVGHRGRERRMAVQELRRQGLLVTGRNSDSLDANPLVRAYFARELKEHQTEAWQAGHLLLYNLCRNGPPDPLGSMQPLFDAMRHGCLAGRQQEVFDEIYDGKVRRQNGHPRVSGSELTALAAFFDPPWDNLSIGLNERSQASILMRPVSCCVLLAACKRL